MFICISSVLSHAISLKNSVNEKSLKFVFKSKDRKEGISLSH